MIYRARKDFTTTDQRGNETRVAEGELVDVLNRHTAKKLLRQGKIQPKKYSSGMDYEHYPAADHRAITSRTAIYLKTSAHYSGGRLHMYQYALALAQNGAEVWLVTNRRPKWQTDYPANERLHVAIEGQDSIPQDFDVIVTDSKGQYGRKAQEWMENHGWCKLVAMNFETPNWVGQYCPEYAASLNGEQWRDAFRAADLQLANSQPSLDYCLQWLGQPGKESAALPPALNPKAMEDYHDIEVNIPERPYAVWSARPAQYKGSKVAQDAIWRLEKPFDMVCFGRPTSKYKNTDQHELHLRPDAPDAEKMALMAGAEMVLAPSLFEGFGMVPMEALAVGTPAIVYDLPVLRWAYGDRPIYVEWGNAEAYRECVARAVEDRPEVDKKTRLWVRDSYGHKAMRERVDTLPYHHMGSPFVTAEMLAWRTAGLEKYALDSVYDSVDQILIAHGPAGEAGWQIEDDGTLERLESYPDPDGKIRIESRNKWANKKQMRNWCADRAEGNYLLMLDADEIWQGLDALIEADIYFGSPRWVTLWHDCEHWIYDGQRNAGQRWGYPLDGGGSVCPHWRCSWWRQSYTFDTHPVPIDHSGAALTDLDQNMKTAEAVPECRIWHLGHALPPEIMREKHKFYRQRDGAPGRRERAWHNWNGGTGGFADGVIAGIKQDVPDVVVKAWKQCHEKFQDSAGQMEAAGRADS